MTKFFLFARRFILLFSLVLGWEFASRAILDKTQATLLPPPSGVFRGAVELAVSGELWTHLFDSLRREAVAFIYASVAIPLGVFMGVFRWVNEQLDAIVEIFRPIPPIAWIPLSILWFGVGNAQNQFIIFLGIFFPILLNTVDAVRGVEPNLVRAARCLGASSFAVIVKVILRAAMPQIVTGIRIGLGVGWMALVAAELVGASSGLGFLINDARTVLRTDYILVGMLTIGFIGLTLDRIVRVVAQRTMPWSRALGG
ncbi:MAG: ABC transporter permease [Betaproteobacteria bacterium]|nr:ABC transporter permease [Betaproteobacteria bacterium]NCA15466.1 ABC transporter permease [Betaproteobacteria bacterium]